MEANRIGTLPEDCRPADVPEIPVCSLSSAPLGI